MTATSIWGATDRGPAVGTMRFPVDTGASSSPGYLTVTEMSTFAWASPTLVTPNIGAATATSVNKYTLTAPASGATIALADGSTLASSGAFSITLTSSASTNVTLPTSGTLYGTASGSITSSQLATSLSDETGSGAAVFGTAPTIVGGSVTALTGFGMAAGQVGQISQPPYVTGRFYSALVPGGGITAANATPLVDNTTYAACCYAAAPIVIKSISIRTSTSNASSGASVKVGVYAADGTNGVPGTRLATTAAGTSITNSATSTDFNIVLDATASVPQGWFYIAILQSSTTGVRLQESSGVDTFSRTNGATTGAGVFAGTPIFGYTVAQTYGSGMPSPFGTAVNNTTVGLNPAFAFEIN